MKEVFRIIGERQILSTIVKMRIRNYTGQCITKYSIVKDNLEGRGEKNGGRRRRQLIFNIRVDDEYIMAHKGWRRTGYTGEVLIEIIYQLAELPAMMILS